MEENPDHAADPDNTPALRHIVRMGADPLYRTKGRIPVDLWGKVPPILGRKRQLSLVDFGRTLRIGGIPQKQSKKEATSG